MNAHVQSDLESAKAVPMNSQQADWANVSDFPETLGGVCPLISCKTLLFSSVPKDVNSLSNQNKTHF